MLSWAFSHNLIPDLSPSRLLSGEKRERNQLLKSKIPFMKVDGILFVNNIIILNQKEVIAY